MGLKDIVKVLILFIIFIIFIIWIIYTLYTIKLANRIKNTTIKSSNDKNSIIDNIMNWYKKEKEKIMIRHLKGRTTTKELEKQLSDSIDAISCGLILLILYLFLSLFYLNIPSFTMIVTVFIIGLLVPTFVTRSREKIAAKKIEKDLLKTITLINNGLSSGKSIREAIISAKDKLDGATKRELEQVVYDLEHGLSLEVAFIRMQKRTNVKDIIYLTTSLSMLSKTGGNMLLMFNYLEKIFKTRKKLDQELSSTIASSKLVFIIMTLIPIIVFIGMNFLYTDLITLYISSPLGNLLAIVIVLLYSLYIIVIRRIMKIEKY